MNVQKLLSCLIFISVCGSCLSKRKVVNYIPGEEVRKGSTTPETIPETMEEILELPRFRDRKSEIAVNPDLWGEALYEYEKMLKKRGTRLGPKGESIEFYKPGLFDSFMDFDPDGMAPLQPRKRKGNIPPNDLGYAAATNVDPLGGTGSSGSGGSGSGGGGSSGSGGGGASKNSQQGSATSAGRSDSQAGGGSAGASAPSTGNSGAATGGSGNPQDRSAGGTSKDHRQHDAKFPPELKKFCKTIDIFEKKPQTQDNTTSSPVMAAELTVSDRILESKIMTVEMVYGGCPDTKVCFGVPSGCIPLQDCRLVVNFEVHEKRPAHSISVNLAGEAAENTFVAVGFSDDRFIGHDVIVYCINSLWEDDSRSVNESKTALFTSFTEGHLSLTQISKENYKINLSPKFGYQQPGVLACSFELAPTVCLDDGSGVDILHRPVYLMLAYGHYIDEVSQSDTNFGALKNQHLVQFSSEPIILAKAHAKHENIEPRSRIWVILHAICAVFACMFCLPSGMFVAKYGREIYHEHVRCLGHLNMHKWLNIHLRFTFTSVLLIIFSMIAILIELGFEWRSFHPLPVTHSALGLLIFLLVPGNIALGIILKSDLSHLKEGASIDIHNSRENVLTWIHWAIGHLTYFGGVVCIVISTSLARAQAPCYVEYFGYTHLVLHVGVYAIMSIDTRELVKSTDGQHMCRRAYFGPMISWTKHVDPNLCKGRRRGVLFYCIVSYLCAFTISVLVTLPVVLCR